MKMRQQVIGVCCCAKQEKTVSQGAADLSMMAKESEGVFSAITPRANV